MAIIATPIYLTTADILQACRLTEIHAHMQLAL